MLHGRVDVADELAMMVVELARCSFAVSINNDSFIVRAILSSITPGVAGARLSLPTAT
jgi:hypothetical protein